MWLFHISSRTEIQLSQLAALKMSGPNLHPCLPPLLVARRIFSVSFPLPTCTKACSCRLFSRRIAEMHTPASYRMDPFVQTRVAMAPDDFSSNPNPRSSCVPRSIDFSTRPGHPSTISRQALSKALLKSRYTIAVDRFCSIATSLNVRSV